MLTKIYDIIYLYKLQEGIIVKIVKFNNKYYKQVNEIYKTSFPKEERYTCMLTKIKEEI